MIEFHAELILDQKALLGEGPSWSSDAAKLLWVDIVQKKIFLFDPADRTNQTVQLDQQVGAVVPRASGGAAAALEEGFFGVDLASGAAACLARPEKALDKDRFNDGKCDPNGRFWAGTIASNMDEPTGALYCLDTDHTWKKAVSGIGCSNGLAWSPDHKTMYYIDSPTKQVVAYDYDLAAGTIENPRVVVTLPEGGGVPDGMTIDSTGMLWVAQWGGWQVSQWNPVTGEQIGRIPIPAAQVTSCCFGGDRLEDLYITTARIGINEEALKDQPHAGGLFLARPGVTGAQTYAFQG